jgi:hypothetical protein
MYFIVENLDQFKKLSVKDECFVQLVTGNDRIHPKLTYPSLLYYNDGEKGYIFPFKHSESFSLDFEEIHSFLKLHKKVYLLDKKFHSYFFDLPNAIDLHFVNLDQTNEFNQFDCDTNLHHDFYSRYGHLPIINEIVPISKHYERCQCLYDYVKGYFDLETDIQTQEDFISAYKSVEENPIKVDVKCLTEKYQIHDQSYSIKGDKMYSCYNLYNLTGRPTNSFNGINFLAIPKENDFRSCFLPSNDFLVEFDFDAYHLRLIARLISFECPKESFHEYLGKQYFNKEELTEEEYKESKTITFKQLYGGVDKKYKHIPFFAKMEEFAEDVWKAYKTQKGYKLHTGRVIRPDDSMTKYKLFNYVVQNMETAENIYKIQQIQKYLKTAEAKTKLILITYDSFLFDFSKKDGKKTLQEIKTILEFGEMKVKHKHGTNYAF